jgi:predicted RNA-binding Zn-ribbon protein involved in translation (DUF1610 family)
MAIMEVPEKRAYAIECPLCGYLCVLRKDKYDRYLTKCPRCGVMIFYRGALSQEWVDRKKKIVSLEEVLL